MVIPNLTLVFDRKKVATGKNQGVVELRISANKQRKYVSTGVKLMRKEWKNGAVTGREDWLELNRQLQSLVKKCQEIITKMMEEGALDLESLPTLLKDGMKQQQTFLQFAHEKAKVIYKKVAPGTKEHYELWFRFMEDWKGIVSFADVTERNIEKMDDELLSRGVNKEVSRWSYHKTLKTFMFKAIKEGLLTKNPYDNLDIKKRSDTGIERYLTPDEFHRFESCKIGPAHLARVRDLFVFQTYTCMSYQDLEAFDYRKCEKVNGLVVYRSNRMKTDKPFMFVLVKPALAILQKYDYKLPIISNVKYNDYLKSAVTYARIDKPVCTHWARHTGATMLLNDGNVPMHVVQHILGHASIRETERTYAKVLDSTIIESMSAYEKRRIKRYR